MSRARRPTRRPHTATAARRREARPSGAECAPMLCSTGGSAAQSIREPSAFVDMSRMNGRSAGPPSGLQNGQPNSRPGVSRANASGGWSLTYSGVDVAVRVRCVVAIVDRRPHRTVGCDGQSGAVADARRERFGGTAARWDAHDRRARRVGLAVLFGDVARRADREVHRAVGSDGDALQRMRVGAAEFGTARIGKIGGHCSRVDRRPVDVVVRVDLVALGDVQRRARERHPVRLVEALEQRRLLRRRTGFRRQFQDLPARGHRHQQRAVRRPRLQPGLRNPRPHTDRPALGYQRLPRLVEWRLGEVAGHVHRRRHQVR